MTGLSCSLIDNGWVKAFLANGAQYDVAANMRPRRHRPRRPDVVTFRSRSLANAELFVTASQCCHSHIQCAQIDRGDAVVDDGSSVGAYSVIEKYCDRGVVLLRQPNSGIGAARNRALSVARGQFVALLALAKLPRRAWLGKEERQAVERTYLQMQPHLDVRRSDDHTHKRDYSFARTALRRAREWRPRWRDRAAQISLAVAPGTTRLARRGRS
jgi:hypothetical protein